MNSSQRIVSRLTASASVRDVIRREASKLLPSLASFSSGLGRGRASRASSGKNLWPQLIGQHGWLQSRVIDTFQKGLRENPVMRTLKDNKWSSYRKATTPQGKTRILRKWCSMEPMKTLESRNNRDWTLRLKEKVLLKLKQKNATRRLSFQGKSKVKIPSYQANKARTREQRRSLSILNSCRGKKKKHLPKEFKVWRHQKIFGTSSMLEKPWLDWLAYTWVIDS